MQPGMSQRPSVDQVEDDQQQYVDQLQQQYDFSQAEPRYAAPATQTVAPYGVMQSPKTQQMYLMQENPKFSQQEASHNQVNYFPVNDGTQSS